MRGGQYTSLPRPSLLPLPVPGLGGRRRKSRRMRGGCGPEQFACNDGTCAEYTWECDNHGGFNLGGGRRRKSRRIRGGQGLPCGPPGQGYQQCYDHTCNLVCDGHGGSWGLGGRRHKSRRMRGGQICGPFEGVCNDGTCSSNC